MMVRERGTYKLIGKFDGLFKGSDGFYRYYASWQFAGSERWHYGLFSNEHCVLCRS